MTLAALMKFYATEMEKDPSYEPPEPFIQILDRLKPLFDVLRPVIEARLADKNKMHEDG